LTKLFKFISFLVLAFTLGYSQGWWRSYENISSPQPLVILTLDSYKNHPLLQEIVWTNLEKVIPYKLVIEKLPNIETLRDHLSANPIKAHLLFLERQDLLQLEPFFTSFSDFSPSLIDRLGGEFILEPKGKYFPILWNNNSCGKELTTTDLRVWGFVLPHISRRASKKSLMFLSDLIHNPISNKILKLTQYHLTFKNSDSDESNISDSLRNSLFF
jgi:hypothetical protein